MIEAYPLHWPLNKSRTDAKQRKIAQFKVKNSKGVFNDITINQAVTRINKELDAYTKRGHTFRVPPNSIIISTNIPVRKDGFPFSQYREPEDPGVAIYFTLDKVQYCLPCDKWTRVADNLAAVAAHIGALRGIERWGVGTTKDTYSGFTALPGTGNFWQIFGLAVQPNTKEDLKAAYNKQIKIFHPDLPTGNREKFEHLNSAYQTALKLFE